MLLPKVAASPVKQLPSSPLKSPNKAKEVLAPITNGVIRTPSKSAPASPLKKVPATPTSIRTPPSTPVKSTPPQNGALTPMAIRRAQLKLLKQDLHVVQAMIIMWAVSGFQAIKQALHTTFPDTLWERDNQFSVLRHFLESNLGGSNPGPASMYISGPPGTGKTVTLLHALTAAKEKMQKKFQEVYVNCMSVHQPQAIFTKIAEELDCKVPGNKDQSLAIEMALTSSSVPMTLVVLDEMDHLLDSKHQEVLYRIFEWPRMERSRLVLVGVANALDFADRFLPRLRTLGCAPRQLTFPPYTRLQIASILQNRLLQASKEGECPQIKPEAVTLCARKVGASTGDLRKALEVVRRAVELVETESRGQLVLQPSPSPRVVGLPQVQRVLCKVDSSAADMAPQLPLHHRLLLATILRLHKTSPQMAFGKGYRGAVSVLLLELAAKSSMLGTLADTYATVCSKFQVDCTQSDCLSICHMLESQGFIRVKSHKEVRLSKAMIIMVGS
ncbi:CDC6 [Cordylochernes scorpioides]|uniref:CDC6 n=1 Tax=Cordylochernes scorpioides TaxID=51811 RepID=A0ABY6KQG6_9ARAC|nr:CDC6 [Cordylochernes scorpioides]